MGRFSGDGGAAAAATLVGNVHGADPTGSADSTAAFQAALDAGDVWIPSGTYNVGLVTYEGSEDRAIRAVPGHRVTIVQTDIDGVFSLRGGWDSLGAISSIADGNVDGNDDGTTQTSVSIITMGGSVTVTKGEIIKVVSDDRPYGFDNTAQSGTVSRRGEWNTVALTSTATTVALASKLVDAYTTSPRLARVWPVSFRVEGDITFTCDPALLDDTGYGATIHLRAARYCVVDGPTFDTVPGRAIANHAFATRVEHVVFKNLSNRPSLSHFGYGVSDGGAHLRVNACHGENLRHMVSENTEDQAVGSSLFEYHGGGFWGLVTNCTAHGCQAAPYDTHDTAYGYTFDGCTATGTFFGASSSGGGATLRGRNGTVKNCSFDSCVYGINVGVWKDALLENNRVTRPSYTPLLLGAGAAGDATITTQAGIEIKGGYYEGSNHTTSRPMSVGSGTLPPIANIVGTTFALIGSGSGSRFLDLNTACRLNFFDCVFDWTRYTNASGATSLFLINDSSTMFLNFFRPKFRVGGTLTGAPTIGSAGAANSSRVRIHDYEWEAWSGSPPGLTKTATNIADVKWSGVERTGTSWFQKNRSSSFAITAAASVSLASLANVLDDHVFCRLTGSAGAVTTGNLPNPEYQGQQITLINLSNGIVTTNSVAIPVNGSATWVYGLGTAAWHLVRVTV